MGRALEQAQEQLGDRDPQIAAGEPGFYLQFELPADCGDAVEALENKPKAIELVAVRPVSAEGGSISATVFVPASAQDFYLRKIEQYRDENTPNGAPRNQALIARIDTVRLGLMQSLFTDPIETYPTGGDDIWWEVWLRKGRLEDFRRVATRLGLPMRGSAIDFPERAVMLLLANEAALFQLVTNTDAIAELRLAKDTPSFFLDMKPSEQGEWVADLVRRTVAPPRLAPAVCILDAGAVRMHPLIVPGLDAIDQHTYDATWGIADTSGPGKGHGTGMAGVALYGDLEQELSSSAPVRLRHRIETVKILPSRGDNPPELYGAITAASVSLTEEQEPGRNRVFCMAVTSSVGQRRGRPSSWSAAIDQLSFGANAQSRLFVLAMGNIRDDLVADEYPDRNDIAEAENPSQSWNALVCGAYTDKIVIADPDFAGFTPLASAGDLCPTSRTAVSWSRQWPIRPDVVFEGGNQAHDGTNTPDPIGDLQLITTHYRPTQRLLSTFGETSAATALAARLAARIMGRRPDLWRESIRGLIVHAAEWTPAMQRHMNQANLQTAKAALMRRYGWGVPNLQRALLSAANDATLIVEDSLFPFHKVRSDIKTRDMNLHRLPWPRDELLALGRDDVEFRITLSYFVEPNPGERGWVRRHRYASHGLRFALKRSLETLDQFRQRINRAAQDEESGRPSSAGADGWLLGPGIRDRGSIHSDIWRGSAAELAARDAVGIFPISGWWKENPALHRWDQSTRYCLIISIRAPNSDVDIYTSIANQIGIQVPAS